MPTRMQYSSIVELVGPLGPVGTLHPGEDGPGLCPIGLTIGLLPVAASGHEGSDDCVANMGLVSLYRRGLYALNVMLLVQYDSRRIVIVSSWGDV